MAPLDLLSRADDGFARRLALVRPGQWAAPTPCTEWDVRALVNHVTGQPSSHELLHGATTDEAEASRAADHLGDDPAASFAATAAELTAAFGEPGAMARNRLPRSELWDLFAAERYQRGETDIPSYKAYNPFRHHQQGPYA